MMHVLLQDQKSPFIDETEITPRYKNFGDIATIIVSWFGHNLYSSYMY